MLEKISNYRIIEEIGAGGMGKIYRAVDERLDRPVALKILPFEIAADRKRLNRFLQEARLAANLNHPNICTIYEVSDSDETPFLAMEMIEGETLDAMISRKSLESGEILRVAAQIADALDEAHQNGVIHRDIKASNIIVNHRGQVKVLDFGLAKQLSEVASEQAVTRARTEDGVLVGTIQYMSPEQALGKKLDGRTDLWSLGVLLYEMACGELPFRAATQAGTFDEILHKNPVFPTELNPEIPFELENIILKLLEKDPDLRYQRASDLLVDLKRLRRALGENGDSLEITNPSLETRPTTHVKAALTRRNRNSVFLFAVALLLIALSGIGFAFYYFNFPKTEADNFQNAQITSLTNLGKVSDAAISPDGKYVVYATDEGATQTLWLKQTATGSNVRVIPPSEVIYQGLAISPDDTWIYYNVWDRKSVGQIFRVPVLGGASQKVAHDAMPGVSVSPDGKRLLFIRHADEPRQFFLLTVGADGSDERRIDTNPDTFVSSPRWSPGGETVAYGAGRHVEGRTIQQIVEVAANTGGEQKVVFESRDENFLLIDFVWLPDKSGFLASVLKKDQAQPQIWKIGYADNSLEQITKGFTGYNNLSVTADGKKLLSLQFDYLSSLWIVSAENPAQNRRLTDGRLEGLGVSWTPDDRLVYGSNVSGNFEIWSMNSDGSGKKQLTFDNFFKVNPCVSGDGKYIFTNILNDPNSGRARMNIDGRNFQIMGKTWNSACAQSAPEVFYLSNPTPKEVKLFRETPERQSSEPVLSMDVISYAVAPDAKKIAYVFWDKEKKGYGYEMLSLETGKVKKFELPLTAVQKFADSQFSLQWTPDGKNLSFVNNEEGFANVWLLPLSGGEPKRITNFNDNFIYSFAWSKDGKKLAVTRGTVTVDAVLLEQK